MEKSIFKITGYVKAVVTREDGSEYVHLDEKNTIHQNYLDAVCDLLLGAHNIALDNLFNGNATPPPAGEDGIAIQDTGALWYEMNCTTTPPSQSGQDTIVVGTFTGVGITIAAAAEVNLGHNYGAPFATIIAIPSSWANLVLGAAETLTITWTISHSEF